MKALLAIWGVKDVQSQLDGVSATGACMKKSLLP